MEIWKERAMPIMCRHYKVDGGGEGSCRQAEEDFVYTL